MFEVDKNSLAKLQYKLERQFPRENKKLARKFIKRVITDLLKEVRAAAPEDTGGLKRSFYVKVLRDKYGEPIAADLRVRTGKKAAGKGRDGFQWRFFEYGTVKMPPRPFVEPALERFRAGLAKYYAEYQQELADSFNED